MAKLITKGLLEEQFKDKMMSGNKLVVTDPVELVETAFSSSYPRGGRSVTDADMAILNKLKTVGRNKRIVLSGKYNNGLDYIFPGRGSINERIRKGAFATGNTLNDNWTDLFDAIRLDLTIKKEAKQTIRQFIYKETPMPNATKDVRPTELFPYAIVFEENNGEGESVRQGANVGGQYDTIAMKIYAAGFVWTLLAALFDNTYDLSRLTEGVALGYAAKKDDLAIAPIVAGAYGTVGTAKWTAASTVGTLRQELLMNTLMDTIDDLSVRTDPVTGNKIAPEGLVYLGSSLDCRHVMHVMTGLGNSTPEKYSALNAISRVVAYDGETINLPNKTVTYAGITAGTGFVIKPNRYMTIPIKRGLTMEIDSTPDVSTLSREERAWYFVEGMYNYPGITNFIQKVTLPAW